MKKLFLLFIALFFVPIAYALPHTFYGTVSEAGTIEGCINGVCQSAISTGSNYIIHLDGNSGDQVQFKLNGNVADQAVQTFVYGGVTNLGLTYTAAPAASGGGGGGGGSGEGAAVHRGGGGASGVPFIPRDAEGNPLPPETQSPYGRPISRNNNPSTDTNANDITGGAVLEEQGNKGLTGITGAVVGAIKKPAGKIIGSLLLLAVIMGILAFIFGKKKREYIDLSKV